MCGFGEMRWTIFGGLVCLLTVWTSLSICMIGEFWKLNDHDRWCVRTMMGIGGELVLFDVVVTSKSFLQFFFCGGENC